MNNGLKRILLIIGCALIAFIAPAQSSHSPIEDVVNAIKSNRVQDMEKYLDNFVAITINNTQSVYSRNQAEVVLHDFFEKNDAKDLHVMDNGSPDNTSKFVIADFNAPAGKFTVYILMKLKDNKFILQEIRLSKE